MNALCTLFTSPKPFAGHDGIIQRNAFANWRALGLPCIVMGDDAGSSAAAQEFGFQHLPEIARTDYGTPLLSDMFAQAQKVASTPLLCYINADILLLPVFLSALQAAAGRWERFLMIGQRWDVDTGTELLFASGWAENLDKLQRQRGKLHSPWGLDYFVFPRGMIRHMLPFAIGRPGWDNWLIWSTAAAGIPLINATQGVPVLHQNHGYGHVPAGRQRTYSGPEGDQNMQMALEDSPDLDPVYASTYRAEWCFDGNGIILDKSWGRLWWFLRRRQWSLKAVLNKRLLVLLGQCKYDTVKKIYRSFFPVNIMARIDKKDGLS